MLVQRWSCLVCSACLLCSVLPGAAWCAQQLLCSAWLVLVLCRCAPCLVCSVQVCALFLLRTVPVSFAVLSWCCAAVPAWYLPAWCLVLPVSFAVLLVPGAAGALVLVQRRCSITSSSAVALSAC